uniref:Reverse transcriptase Ty1/copia-type domain-containing protein n=1 Tax=Tanacetum cinerariifolium TaxID=118510 RepID=A0A6L2JX54_TANCI|nr:hypothetical protein [Tanacetum cinerariifolium]
MNWLVRHNLVRGLPSKCFDNDHTCAACLKGKQHNASCKTKLVNSVTKPLYTLHMYLFGPTSDETSSILRNFITEIENLKEHRVKIIRVLVNKSQNKTPYELFNDRSPTIGFLKPFGCHVMILNTLDNLGKFEAKEDEGYFIGYSMSSKAFRFHEAHLETSTSNAQDVCNTNGPKSSGNFNLTATSTNPPTDHMETLAVETPIPTVSSPVPTACLNDAPEPSSDTRLISKRVTSQDDTPSLDNILTLTNRFEDILGVTANTDDTNGMEADLGNMEENISASPTPTLRIHKDHPKSQIIGPVDTPVQTRTKSQEIEEHSFIATIHQKINPALLYEELLQFKIQNVWSLVDCPKGVRPIGTKWVLKNKKDERGILIRNKARLVAQGHTQEEGIDYDEVFTPIAKIEAIRLFLAYASLMGPDGSYSDIDYGGASQDHKSTTGGCQFLGRRLISWQYKKQIIVATSTTEAEYVAYASGCGQVLWIQNQLLDYGLSKPCEALSKEISSYTLLLIETTEEGTKILATVDGKLRAVSESSIRRNLKLNNECLSPKITGFNEFNSNIANALVCLATNRVYNFLKMIFDDELASPLRDDSQGEACPTDSGFEADQDRANITKTSTLPSDLTPRVTSFAADKGSMQIKLTELTDLVKLLGDREGGGLAQSREDALIKGRTSILTSVVSVSISPVTEIPVAEVPTGSGSIPIASPPESTPYTRRKGKKKMAESDTPKKKKLQEQIDVQVARELDEEMVRDVQRMNEQIARDVEIARIHAKEELQMMIDGLDRNNEITQQRKPLSRKQQRDFYMAVLRSHAGWIAKHFKGMTLEEIKEKFDPVWKQMQDFIPIGYKEEGERFKIKGLRLEQESAKKVKIIEEVPKEKLKEMMQLIPVEEVYVETLQAKHPIIDWEVHTEGQRSYWKIIRLGGSSVSYQFFVDLLKHFDREDLNQLWALVKETFNIRPAVNDKEKELWVELKRLYEPDV